MKAKLIGLIIVFCCAFIQTHAQKNTMDAVFLNDGSVIRGTVIEYVAEKHITIQSSLGNSYTFSAEEIKDVKLRINASPIQVQKRGYFNQTGVGIAFGTANYSGVSTAFSFNTVNGYQFGTKYQAGVGLGMDVFNGFLYFPVYADVRYNFRKTAFTPYVGLQAGHTFGDNGDGQSNYYDIYYYNPQRVKGGLMAGVELGIKNYFNSSFGFTVSAGYRFQKLNSSYYNWQFPTVEVIEKQYLHRIRLSLGFTFN